MYNRLRATAKTISKPQATVCFRFKNERLHKTYAALDRSSKAALSTACRRKECSGASSEVVTVYDGSGRRFLLLGLGEMKALDADVIRKAGGALVRALDRVGVSNARIVLHPRAVKSLGAEALGRALGEGLGLASFRFNSYKTSDEKPSATTLTVGCGNTRADAGIARGLTLAEATNVARKLAATPPNVATPRYIAAEAQKLARRSSQIRCSVIKGAALEKHKMVGLRVVGQASENPPCMIELIYTPRKKPTATIVLVGKTVTYDTGGLSLKISNAMKGMKYDKCGGMAVLGAMHAIAALKPACKVVALLPAAENSVSDEAYRPDDIIHYPNGVWVEVTNTDAEGRLVLADGLIYGCKRHRPDAIIDLATLTGGIVVALGRVYAGYWCDDKKLRQRVEAAAETSGERLWRMPHHADYNEMMKSKHADVWNSAPVREAHPIQGAAFLSYFVDEKVPWAHIDIAGTASIDKDRAPFAAGPTGFGVRLLADLLMNWK